MSTYALLHEGIELALILNVDELLAAVGRVGNVQLKGEKTKSALHILQVYPRVTRFESIPTTSRQQYSGAVSWLVANSSIDMFVNRRIVMLVVVIVVVSSKAVMKELSLPSSCQYVVVQVSVFLT